MMNFKNTLPILLSFIVFNNYLFAQRGSGKFCIDAEPLCALSTFSYPNSSGLNFAESGPDYGCLIGQINPSWFYFQISNDGNIKLKIEQSISEGGIPNLDVDFILYGPFNDPRSPCISDLTLENIVDCSYETDFVEFVDINNTKAGEFYLLLITNFSRQPGYITVTQIYGAATTNCVWVEDPIVKNEYGCEGDSITLDASTADATHYKWFEDDGNGNFTLITGLNNTTLGVTSTNIYTAEAYNDNNVLIKKYEFHASFYQIPKVPTNISDYRVCDDFGDNDGIAQFDFATKDAEILNGLDPNNFVVSYYDNITDAFAGTNILPNLYTNTSQSHIIYTRIINIASTTVQCFDVGSFNIMTHKLPEVILDDSYILCIDTNGTEVIATPPVIDTGMSVTDYDFIWRLNNEILPSETDGFLIPSQEGSYSVEVIQRSTNCSNMAFTSVVLSAPPIVSAEVVSYAFIEDNTIEVSASGIGIQEHEFSLDYGPWQTNSIFNNVPIGEHIITVRNTIGCGETSVTIMLMDYPLYFTPNGDGYHDIWNITGIQNQPEAQIYIFDRYGKLLKQLIPSGSGWDGTYNGVEMPTNDYWFTVTYKEPKDGTLKQFKSHFTLKR